MKAHEMFLQMSPAIAVEVVAYFYNTDRNVFKTTVSTLATQRKLRPVFVTRKSRDMQFEWVIKALQTRRSDEIAQHLLQAWLMKAKSELLIAFLDKLGIEHDGTGAVEELPKALDAAKLRPAIDTVLGQFPAEEVTLYLHMFQLQEVGGWPELAEVLQDDSRLRLGTAAAGETVDCGDAAAGEETVPAGVDDIPRAEEELPGNQDATT